MGEPFPTIAYGMIPYIGMYGRSTVPFMDERRLRPDPPWPDAPPLPFWSPQPRDTVPGRAASRVRSTSAPFRAALQGPGRAPPRTAPSVPPTGWPVIPSTVRDCPHRQRIEENRQRIEVNRQRIRGKPTTDQSIPTTHERCTSHGTRPSTRGMLKRWRAACAHTCRTITTCAASAPRAPRPRRPS
jgi:hypothetical protein